MNFPTTGPFNPTLRMLRQFAGLWILFFLGMAIWQQVHYDRPVAAVILGVLAVVVGPVGLIWPAAIRFIFIGWMLLAFPIGWVVSRIVLGVIFFGVFTPVAALFRLSGRDALGLKRQPAAATYWIPKPAAANNGQYLRQF